MRRLLWVSSLLTAKFWILELIHGQTNVLLGLLALGAVAAAVHKRPIAAGVLAGAAVFVQTLRAGAAAVADPRSRRAGARRVAATLAAGLVAPALAYGWSGNLAALREWAAGVGATTAESAGQRKHFVRRVLGQTRRHRIGGRRVGAGVLSGPRRHRAARDLAPPAPSPRPTIWTSRSCC